MRTQAKRLLLTFLALFGVSVVVIISYDVIGEMRWSGGYQLEVTLARQSDRKIARITAEAVGRKEWADNIRADPRAVDLRSEPFVPVTNGPFSVQVRCGGRTSALLGRELGYFNYELLVLRIEYDDGKIEYVTAEINRKQRHITVSIP